MIAAWRSLAGSEEYALSCDRSRDERLLMLPPLFEESNKMRHFLAELMHLLDAAGIDSFLPDLPGQNESLAPLAEQSLASWRAEAEAAAKHFRASHVLAIRGGALITPAALPGWLLAAAPGASLLRGMLRARVLSAKEAGREEERDTLLKQGRQQGLELAGYRLGAAMIRELETAEILPGDKQVEIVQSRLGGPGLWLRAEPDHSPDQAALLAELIAQELAA